MRDWMDVLVTESGENLGLKWKGNPEKIWRNHRVFRSPGCPTVNQPAPLAGGSNDRRVAELLSQDRPILKPNTVQGWRTE